MTTYFTEYSTYEVDEHNKLVRRTRGLHPTTNRFTPEGEWKGYEDLMELAGDYGPRLLVVWPDRTMTATSAVIIKKTQKLLENLPA
jgi:hypothetical protein